MNSSRTIIGLGLSFLLLGGTHENLRAEQGAPAPAKPAKTGQVAATTPKKPIYQQLSGRVVAVDKTEKTLTLQVDNLTYVLQVADSTKISKKGGERTINDIIVGEDISVNVVLRELPNGRVEVAVLSVELSETVAAQGKSKGKSGGKENKGRGQEPHSQPPFQHEPNPGNQDGPIISRNR